MESTGVLQEYSTLFSILGTAAVGIVLVVVRSFLTQPKESREAIAQYRQQLQDENEDLREENRSLRGEVAEIRTRYIKALEKIEDLTKGTG